jgi:hypothetical protein
MCECASVEQQATSSKRKALPYDHDVFTNLHATQLVLIYNNNNNNNNNNNKNNNRALNNTQQTKSSSLQLHSQRRLLLQHQPTRSTISFAHQPQQ